MKKNITVTIPESDLMAHHTYHQQTWHIMRVMREAGMPVNGTMRWEGMTAGRVTHRMMPESGDHVYTWSARE